MVRWADLAAEAAEAAGELVFHRMSEAHMREWVEENPELVNLRDFYGEIPLSAAVRSIKSLPLVVWLLDEKGADLNIPSIDYGGYTTLHRASSPAILSALMDRGADPTRPSNDGYTPIY
jgi:hypothetical protein